LYSELKKSCQARHRGVMKRHCSNILGFFFILAIGLTVNFFFPAKAIAQVSCSSSKYTLECVPSTCTPTCSCASGTCVGSFCTDPVCNTPCAGTMVGSCPAASTVLCGTPFSDSCGNSCGTGTKYNAAQCTAASTIACGTTITDNCGNSCGTTGTMCSSGTCSGGICSTPTPTCCPAGYIYTTGCPAGYYMPGAMPGGSCPTGYMCSICSPNTACPSSNGCSTDSCGTSCGTCTGHTACSSTTAGTPGTCVATCTPNGTCTALYQCGSGSGTDNCGNSCSTAPVGTCSSGDLCINNVCTTCATYPGCDMSSVVINGQCWAQCNAGSSDPSLDGTIGGSCASNWRAAATADWNNVATQYNYCTSNPGSASNCCVNNFAAPCQTKADGSALGLSDKLAIPSSPVGGIYAYTGVPGVVLGCNSISGSGINICWDSSHGSIYTRCIYNPSTTSGLTWQITNTENFSNNTWCVMGSSRPGSCASQPTAGQSCSSMGNSCYWCNNGGQTLTYWECE